MFECMEQMLVQFIECIPTLLGLYLIFNFTGNLLFKE